MIRPAYQAWQDAKARGLKGKTLLPFRQRMSAEAAKLHAIFKREKRREDIQHYILLLESALENLRAQGVPEPYFFRIEADQNKHIEAQAYLGHLRAEIRKIK